MLLSPRQTRLLYEHAIANRYGILAVNADSPAAVTDCLIAAKQCGAPVIVETSLWQLTGHSFGAGDPFLGIDRYLAGLRVLANAERFAAVPVVYHTDHIKGPETLAILKHAMRAGASSISLDSSELSPGENIAFLRELCDFAEAEGLAATLEMEAGVDDGVTSLEETRSLLGAVESSHPGHLALWAPGVGTRHGLGDMGGFDPDAVARHQELASEIAGRPVGVALHGSSGLTGAQLRAAVAAGAAKINWSSESLLLRSAAARRYFAENGDRLERDKPDFKAFAMDHGQQSAMSGSYVPGVIDRMKTLGGEGAGSAFLQALELAA